METYDYVKNLYVKALAGAQTTPENNGQQANNKQVGKKINEIYF